MGPGERWTPAWHLLFFATLTAAALQAATQPDVSMEVFAPSVPLATFLAIWYWQWPVRRSQRLLTSTTARVLYFVVAGATWTILVLVDANYSLLSFSAFVQVFGYLPWRGAVLGAFGVVAIIHLPDLVRGDGIAPDQVLDAALMIAFVVLISVTMHAVATQSARRQRLLDELQATRDELAIAERQAGMLEERERLARDIHDTVTQGLSSIVMLLEAARASLGSSRAATAGHIEQALQAARDSLREVRRLVWALRPESLEQGTVAQALERLAERFSKQTGIATRAVVTGQDRRLATEVEVTLLRAAQEAMANIRRHSHARQGTITLSYMGDEVALDVRDDGIGFNPQELPGSPREGRGLGLVAMRERVESLSGSLIVESSPREGTTVAVRLPVDDRLQKKPGRRPKAAAQ